MKCKVKARAPWLKVCLPWIMVSVAMQVADNRFAFAQGGFGQAEDYGLDWDCDNKVFDHLINKTPQTPRPTPKPARELPPGLDLFFSDPTDQQTVSSPSLPEIAFSNSPLSQP